MKRVVLFMMMLTLSIGMASAKVDKQQVTFYVDLHCQGCIDKIYKNIAFEKGVKDIVCDLKSKTVTVTFDADKTDIENLLKAFDKIGKPAKIKENARVISSGA